MTTSSFCLAGGMAVYDYGDAPNEYGTFLYSDGPRHYAEDHIWLGTIVDAEYNGQPSVMAIGDDTYDGIDDEDGITFPPSLAAGAPAAIDVNAGPTGGLLDAWIDFDQSFTFDPDEKIMMSHFFGAGDNLPFSIDIPADAVLGNTYARFRLSTAGGLLPTGIARDGEVEDYYVTIVPEPITLALLGCASLVMIKRRRIMDNVEA